MAANGINTVRIPHTMPPRSLLWAARRHGLRVMVGLSAEQYLGFLIDRKKSVADIEALVRAKVRECAGHPALLCYALGNEIPSTMARWLGRRKIERYLKRLYRVIKEERSEEHTSELQSQSNLVCRLLLEKKNLHRSSRS